MMKKVFLMLAVAMCSMLAMAQTQQITWVNGRAVLGQSISAIDSLKYGTMEDADQLVLWLPKTIVVHDTVIVHDTVYVQQGGGSAPAGVEMVDLGLSVKWANMNVGATCSTTVESWYGDYFAWGETEAKSSYSWSTYKWCNGSYNSQTKYCTSSSYGTVDNKTVLEAADDAARANWGGSWRMPTKAEQDELRNNCTWTWTTNYQGISGLNGYVVSATNGNSIFLPAAGCRDNSSLSGAGSYGDYWSSSLDEGYSDSAYYLYFLSGYVDWLSIGRYDGQSVRPVCQ